MHLLGSCPDGILLRFAFWLNSVCVLAAFCVLAGLHSGCVLVLLLFYAVISYLSANSVFSVVCYFALHCVSLAQCNLVAQVIRSEVELCFTHSPSPDMGDLKLSGSIC